ncbi:hypothetical protein [Streptomyces olivaceus]|uniref:hypothetical protein n=1 Tax=Streptomyces olivaceus TaxID=47716 RepID=UPI0036319D26
MNGPGRVLTTAYAAAFCFLIHCGLTSIDHRAWAYTIAFNVAALVVALAAYREWERGADARAAAVYNGRPRSGVARRGDIRAILRAERHAACLCDHWWLTFGTRHDRTCPRVSGR